MGHDRPVAATTMKALTVANRRLLAAMAREKRAAAVWRVADEEFRAARRGLSLLVSAVAEP